MKTVRVMVVDDSFLFREWFQKELERDCGMQVVSKAADAFDARDKLPLAQPDILVVDIYMERMDGFAFIRQLMPQYPVPVVFISSDPSRRAQAEQVENALFVEKPQENNARQQDIFIQTVLLSIRTLLHGIFAPEERAARIAALVKHAGVIAIGASTGGAEAIETVLRALPPVLPPIVIAQHMPPKFTKSFADRLHQISALSVKEAETGEPLLPGQVYIAPGGFHLSVRLSRHRYLLHCEENTGSKLICPNVDFLFRSVAQAAGRRAIGVLLTGMGRDGADGLLRMRQAGARTIGQDEASAVIYGMPKVAFQCGAVEQQLPLSQISDRLRSLSWIEHR